MRVLAIDTSLGACAVALLDTASDEIVTQQSIEMARGHAEALMPLVAEVMNTAAIDFREIDRIAVTVGPGSFTGLRVGIAAARGLALATARPAVGVTTFAAFAAPHLATGEADTIVAAIDARHHQIYVEMFDGREGTSIQAPQIAAISDVASTKLHAPVLLVGSGANLLAQAWPPAEAVPALDQRPAPDIAWVARLGASADPARALPRPFYLRGPDARPQDAARLQRR